MLQARGGSLPIHQVIDDETEAQVPPLDDLVRDMTGDHLPLDAPDLLLRPSRYGERSAANRARRAMEAEGYDQWLS